MAAAFFAALVVTTVITAIIGYLCLRGDSMTFALLHLAFNILLYTLVVKWRGLTGGEPGIMGASRPEIFSGPIGYFFFVLIVVVICYVLIRIVLNSPFSRVAQGLRENEERLLFLGINTRRFQLVTFIISGFFAAVAGILLAMLDKGTFPAYINLTRSAEGLMMCLIGGMYSFFGPTIGATIVVIVGTVTSTYLNQWQGLLGVIIIACVIGFRGGILGKRKSKIKVAEAVKK
ncbi:MAG: hypothetical protein A2Z29_10345 [Chloroflexi bacterium RBG_16_56_11]|nr:MAG: hypothetical protein A2Z29_10345 [Chloroflexi bacterium RBG_16_56_11]